MSVEIRTVQPLTWWQRLLRQEAREVLQIRGLLSVQPDERLCMETKAHPSNGTEIRVYAVAADGSRKLALSWVSAPGVIRKGTVVRAVSS